MGEGARQVLDPDRLTAMLDAYVLSAAAEADGAKAQLAKLRHDHTAVVAGIARLLELVEKGLMEAEDLTIEQVDALTGTAIGWPRTGTFCLADLVGLDVMAHVASNFAQIRGGAELALPQRNG